MLNTPQANRLHIGIFGRCNSGKSSLINAIINQDIAIVSSISGTTTDPVYKAMEVSGLGACVFIDTPGFDDESELGELRVQKTEAVIARTDIAILVCGDDDISQELAWARKLQAQKIPIIMVINKQDIRSNQEQLMPQIEKELSLSPLLISCKTKFGLAQLQDKLVELLPEDYDCKTITGDWCRAGDVVLLVMPQDIQAPKGRLILPQVQTIRELLDKKCVVLNTTTDCFEHSLSSLRVPPQLIITDSQVFKTINAKKPALSKITSFSMLFAEYKGDMQTFIRGLEALDTLSETSRVLIAEACAHPPQTEDIGRIKIPRILRQRYGQSLKIDIVSGADFPEDLSPYDLIIHCGACMFNRRHVLSRIAKAKAQNVPITNYGLFLCKS